MRDVKDRPGIQAGGYNLNNLYYAGSSVLIALNTKELPLLGNVIIERIMKGLALIIKKTQTVQQNAILL